MAVESVIQDGLAALYRIDDSPPVLDFRIGEELQAFLTKNMGRVSERREALMVAPGEEWTDLALFLSDEVVAGAEDFSTQDHGRGDRTRNLDAFCAAVEGVSHFVYFTFCGGQQDRPVSCVELELQAEIDKFLLLRVLFETSGQKLLAQLFDAFQISECVPANEHGRYRFANRQGRRYARWLEACFRTGRGDAALEDARLFYRLPFEAKLDRIARAA